MIEISSESVGIFEFIKRYSHPKITLDIETLDSKSLQLWNEPIVSFSLSFVSDDYISSKVLVDFPTSAFGITDVNEEKNLLMRLKEILTKFPRNSVIIGHNVSYELECKRIIGWDPKGYDIPKILTRSKLFNLNLDFIKEFETYDTMDIAYLKFNHKEHGKLISSGEPKKFLRSDELEEFFNIKRPKNLPKLGALVREYFEKKKYKEILLYNCSDTIIESIFYRLFEHKLNFCKQNNGLISFKKNCEHIPKIIKVEDVGTWKRLISEKFLKM